MNKKMLSVAIVGVLLLIGLVGGVVTFAQTQGRAETEAVSPAEVDAQAPVTARAGNGYGRGHGGPAGQGLLAADQEAIHAAMAAALGLTVEELDAALAEGTPLVVLADELGVELEAVRESMAAARADALEQAVADGLVTAEQAEWMQNRAGSPAGQGGGPGMGPGPNMGDAPGLGFVDEAEMHAAIADALGIEAAELEAALAEGTPLAVLAQDLGIELPVVREAMTAVREAALDQAVADGLITAEQAEWYLNRPAFGERAGSAYGAAGSEYQGSGPGMGRAGRSGNSQHGRPTDGVVGRGSGNGRGYSLTP